MRNGIGYYKACLKFHTTSDMSPDEAHVTGLDEVERIAKQINKVNIFHFRLMTNSDKVYTRLLVN